MIEPRRGVVGIQRPFEIILMAGPAFRSRSGETSSNMTGETRGSPVSAGQLKICQRMVERRRLPARRGVTDAAVTVEAAGGVVGILDVCVFSGVTGEASRGSARVATERMAIIAAGESMRSQERKVGRPVVVDLRRSPARC